MASIATPQQSFAHMAAPLPQASPPNGLPNPPYGAHGYSMSFGGESNSQHSYSSSQPPPAYPLPGYSRSFGSLGDGYAGSRGGYEGKPQIYTAVYSGVSVYEMEINGIACMRRRSDGWLNATQILKVAGVDKGKRTKVLEKEILTGEHEKVQGGYGKYQGTWISYKRGREFCRQYGVEDVLRPLLDYDVSTDGTGGQGGGEKETPTKEQAMAANRKRFYGASGVPESNVRQSGGGPTTNGTFFSNISPTTSVALAAMNKAARLNSPAPRPSGLRRPSQPDGFMGGSQQSMLSDGSFNDKYDSAYGTQPNGEPPRKRLRPDSQDGGMAPPILPFDASMRSATPTEPNDSFVYDGTVSQEMINGNGDPVALAPLPNPATEEQHDKMGLVLDLFADAGRMDYTNHPALSQLSGEDLNIPLDASANNALHWAATLAKVPLLKLLIQKGANIYRGNAAGQSPLISAVLVNNCWEQSCFPELLELLGPLIEIRDIQGRTILHHIAVSSGIKGRAPSSKYYLEALLEFLVRIGTHSSLNITTTAGAGAGTGASSAAQTAAAIQDAAIISSQDSFTTPAPTAPVVQSSKGPVTLVRFLSHIVNARDKAGNTALNLVARVGNRSIIQQLIEIHADPALPNHKGVSAKDFGVVGTGGHAGGVGGLGSSSVSGTQASFANGSQSTYPMAAGTQDSATMIDEDGTATAGTAEEGTEAATGSQVEDLGQDVISSMTSMLTQSLVSHKETLRVKSEQIDALNAQIREFSALQKRDLESLYEVKGRVRVRGEMQAKVANLRRCIADKKRRSPNTTTHGGDRRPGSPSAAEEVSPAWLTDENALALLSLSPSPSPISNNSTTPTPDQVSFATTTLPPSTHLRHLIQTYTAHNSILRAHSADLEARSGKLEALYRKVVSLCTGVEEGKVEGSLGSLVAAVESERGAMGVGEVGRVREFLRRVDGVTGSSAGGGGVGVGVEG